MTVWNGSPLSEVVTRDADGPAVDRVRMQISAIAAVVAAVAATITGVVGIFALTY